ncbi:HU family DNA-binding protein [Leyella stercorea]|uniref:HU family DNA-binding protein n=1 Tax=Leyella stercorea TaxID=363265 RepID=UPI001C2B7970|nr:HU family DNA-binding protein [Leyella stercorea]MBU9946261.1 HU family DNA-binding protein [Leyella stercorea]
MAKVNDFARELSEKYGLSLGDASDFVSAMFDVVKEELDGADSSVKIKGFGTFKVSAVGARASVDVNTGERIIIDGRNKISFTPEVLLRDRVNRPFVQFETVVLNDGVDFSEIDEESEEELDSVTETEPQGVQLSPTAPTNQSTDQPAPAEQPQGVQLSSTAPTSQPTDQSTDQPTHSEQPQGVQLSSTAPTSQPTDQLTDHHTLSEQTQEVQLSPTAPTSQPTDQSTDQPTLSEQSQGVQLSPTAPTGQSTNPQSPSVTASKAVNTEEHRDMARRLMTPKTETIEEGSEESDDKTTATAPEADDEGIVIGGCRQRSPRIMYVLTIASFLILVSLGIGMYFLYQRIEEKNHVIDRLESRLYAQQEAAERADAQPAVAVKDTIVSNDSLRAAELHAAEKAKKDSIAASKSAAEAKASQSSVAPSTATTPSDYNYDTRVRTGAYIIVGVAKTVTVQPGQTLASISKAYLGEGMECYVEVLNNRHSVKAGEKLKIPQLKLKPRKR